MEELQWLVISAQDSDKDAFGKIIPRFQDMAYAVAYAMLGDTYLAEDVAQEAFIDAYLSIPNLREPAAFPGWFRRVVIKHSDRQIRGKRPQILPLDKAFSVPAKTPGPEVQVEQLQLKQAVSEAIASLSKSQRQERSRPICYRDRRVQSPALSYNHLQKTPGVSKNDLTCLILRFAVLSFS